MSKSLEYIEGEVILGRYRRKIRLGLLLFYIVTGTSLLKIGPLFCWKFVIIPFSVFFFLSAILVVFDSRIIVTNKRVISKIILIREYLHKDIRWAEFSGSQRLIAIKKQDKRPLIIKGYRVKDIAAIRSLLEKQGVTILGS